MAWDHLPDRLRDIFAIRVQRIAYLKADDDIDFQEVADVIAIAKFAGVDRMGLLTEDGKHQRIRRMKIELRRINLGI